jgi:hypothetical protein
MVSDPPAGVADDVEFFLDGIASITRPVTILDSLIDKQSVAGE